MARDASNTRLMEEERPLERVDEHEHDWTPPQFTAAPPPREGMEQRWMRVRAAGVEDVQNVLRRRQAGWTPRPAETIPDSYKFMIVRHGDMGNILATQDAVLVERPLNMGARFREYNTRQASRLSESIRQFVGDNMPRRRGTTGGKVEELNITAEVGKRRQRFADD